MDRSSLSHLSKQSVCERHQHLTIRSFALQRLPKEAYLRDVPEEKDPIPIAIVGRPNVGKSSLFNRLQSVTKKKEPPVARRALVSNKAGTTRDRKDAIAVFGGLVLRVIDTGGLEGDAMVKDNTLLAGMQQQVWRAVSEAAAILLVIDAKEGITPLDIEIAKQLKGEIGHAHSYRDKFSNFAPEDIPVILVANKAEKAFMGPYLNDCYDLGLGDPVSISAMHCEGMEDLYDRLCLEVGHMQEEDDDSDEQTEEATVDEDAGSEEQSEEELSVHEDHGFLGDPRNAEAPQPTLPWLAPLSPDQKRSLRWFAKHPGDPLGQLDPGLKASVLHRDAHEMKNYWLSKPQRILPDPATRDFVMKFRRLEHIERPLRMSVIGMPSSGKSSLINALLQEERVVVDPSDGTTMDPIVSEWTFKDQPFKLIDTCGIVRGWKYPGDFGDILEPGMGTQKAVRQSNVVVLCVDAQRHRLLAPNSVPTKFEVRLGNFVADEGKCLVIAINKWDLIPEEDQERHRKEILDRIADKFASVKGVPVVFMSAKYNLNLPTLMTRVLALHKRWNARLPTGKLNDWLQAWMIRWPPPWRFGQKRTVKYMTQTRTRPPSFVMWSNTTAGEFPKNYLQQLKNAMREEFRISGVPMRMMIRSTLWPKPRMKMKPRDILKWKRIGPKQAAAVSNLTAKKTVRRQPVTD